LDYQPQAMSLACHMKILVLNSGSSSQKSALFELDGQSSAEPVAPLWEGQLDWDGNHEVLSIRNSTGKRIRTDSEITSGSRQASVEHLLQNLWGGPAAVLQSASEIHSVGHRIVHGGPNLTQPVIVTSEVKRAIADLSAIAPLHNQAGLDGIALIEKLLPSIPQVAVFDTGFHRTLPAAAKIYAGPYDWYEHGIRRFGFHGINHEYCANRATQLLGRDLGRLKVISCHLGNGCSLAAIDAGKSVNTTMGFTPLEGLMMGTRTGSIDPGILTHLLRTKYAGPNDLDGILNHKAGLLGISGISSDMRDILEAMRKGNERAKLAFDIFVHRLCSEIGAMAASLGGFEVLVFTAGIGENSAEVRAETCTRLQFLGIEIDSAKNAAVKPDARISPPDSKVDVLVIRAQEDWSIARECLRMSGQGRV
jgi:acetate kinase